MVLVQKPIKSVYLGTTKVRPTGAFIPDTSRTLLYMKFANNMNDSSGNGESVTSQGIGYGTIGKYHYAEITSNSNYDAKIQPTASIGRVIGTGDFTISFRGYAPNFSGSYGGGMFFGNWCDLANPRPGPSISFGWDNYIHSGTSNNTSAAQDYSLSKQTWYHYCMARRSGTAYLYINGVLKRSWTSSETLANVDTFWLLQRPMATYGNAWNGATGARISEVIYEKVGWSASDISTYFDATKADYGVS